MNSIERIQMVKAMEFVARQVNDENVFDTWLSLGVADGDIEYGDLAQSMYASPYELAADYITDDVFAELMETFLIVMTRARKSGGLYCDGVVSK